MNPAGTSIGQTVYGTARGKNNTEEQAPVPEIAARHKQQKQQADEALKKMNSLAPAGARSILRESPTSHLPCNPEIEALCAAGKTIRSALLTVFSGTLQGHLAQLTWTLNVDVLHAEESGVISVAGLARVCEELCSRLAELAADNDVDGYVDALTSAFASINAEVSQFTMSEDEIKQKDLDKLRSDVAPKNGTAAKSVRWADKQPHDITEEEGKLKSDKFDECRGFDLLFGTLQTEIAHLSHSCRDFGTGRVGATLARRLKAILIKLEGMKQRYNGTLPGWKSAVDDCQAMYLGKLEEAAQQRDVASFQFLLHEMATEVQRQKGAGNGTPVGRDPGAQDFGLSLLFNLGVHAVAVAASEDERNEGGTGQVLTLSCGMLKKLYGESLEKLREGLGGKNVDGRLDELKRCGEIHFDSLFRAAKQGDVEGFLASMNLFFEALAQVLNQPNGRADAIGGASAVDAKMPSATATVESAALNSSKRQALAAVKSVFGFGLGLMNADEEALSKIHGQLKNTISKIDAEWGSTYARELQALSEQLDDAIRTPSGLSYSMVLDGFLQTIKAS